MTIPTQPACEHDWNFVCEERAMADAVGGTGPENWHRKCASCGIEEPCEPPEYDDDF